ncbi:hypothetical protein BCEP4_300016 [Burkholderia cepacia]|nr:hypothetical protein BCEP4_300016 [Burkholderia cepacia]
MSTQTPNTQLLDAYIYGNTLTYITVNTGYFCFVAYPDFSIKFDT